MAASQKYSDVAMLAALQSAADGRDQPLTAAGYDAVRLTVGGPSALAVIKRFGTWRAALHAAGLAANEASGHRRHWTEEELVGWVAAYLATPSATGSYSSYTTWATAVPGAPSGPTVRNAFRTWVTARTAAEERNSAG